MTAPMVLSSVRNIQIRRLSTVTFENVFSNSNRNRVQELLLKTKPVRELPLWAKGKEMKKAAVLVPICTIEGQPSVLFTVRSSELTHHKGEVSFPGGLQDETDTDFIHTALRETEEELGISGDKVDVWGTMSPVPGKNYETLVTPVVGLLGEVDVDLIDYNKDEVAEVFGRSLSSLAANPVRKTYPKRDIAMPEFLGGEHRIWGLTAVVLHEALTLIGPGLYTFKMKYFIEKK